MRIDRFTVCLVLPLLSGTIGRREASADIIANGYASVSNAVRFDWGPLAGNASRPATARDGETWESFAARESGDVRWAPTLRAMNGGGEKPDTGADRTWVPPSGRAFDGATRWFSVYADSSKFGPDSDISRTGFHRVDPDAATIPVFAAVTVVALEHRTADDAATSFTITRSKATDVLARRTAPALLIAPSHEVADSVPTSSPTRRVEHAWRVEMPTADSLRVVTGNAQAFDAAGHPIGVIIMEQIFRDGGTIGWFALAGGALLAVLVVAALLRRNRSNATKA